MGLPKVNNERTHSRGTTNERAHDRTHGGELWLRIDNGHNELPDIYGY